MSDAPPFPQNVIAIIWDFDKTLSPHYMQDPLFDAYDVDDKVFWAEVNALPEYYARAGIHIQPDTSYLSHLLTYVQQGKMPGLNNARLNELGDEITLFPGLPDFFDTLKDLAIGFQTEDFKLTLEHYVVSTGLGEMIRGSKIADKLNGVWASEFIETPAAVGYDPQSTPQSGVISQIAGFLDNTTKTRAIFEINKGVNKYPKERSVNDTIELANRRVPFENMIYVADGPSDIPSFSVMRKNGGLAYAVYDENDQKQFARAEKLSSDERVNAFGPANYATGQTVNWLKLKVSDMAQRLQKNNNERRQRQVSRGPQHIDE